MCRRRSAVRWRPRPVAVLPHLHRHRDDEGDRGQACRWSAWPGPGRTRCARSSTRCAAGRGRHLQEGDEQARLLHPARLLAVRRGHRGRAGRRGVQGRPARRVRRATSTRCTPSTTWSRSTCARRCRDGVAPEHAAFATVGVDRDARRAARRGPARRDGVRHRPRPRRPARRPAARRGRGPGRRARPDRGALPAGGEGRGGAVRGARRDGMDAVAARARRDHRRARCRPHLPGRWRVDQRPGRDRGPARPGPRARRRHRQDEARPALERLLREGTRRPVLPVLRPRAVRRPVRA